MDEGERPLREQAQDLRVPGGGKHSTARDTESIAVEAAQVLTFACADFGAGCEGFVPGQRGSLQPVVDCQDISLCESGEGRESIFSSSGADKQVALSGNAAASGGQSDDGTNHSVESGSRCDATLP